MTTMTTEQLEARLDRIETMLTEILGRPSSPYKDVMNTAEIAQYLGVTPGHIRTMVSDGKIPCYKSGNSNRNYFRRTEIDDWKAADRRKTNRELQIEAATRSAISRNRR